MKKVIIILILVLVAGISYGGYWYYTNNKAATEYTEEEVEIGDIVQTVSATGSLAALTTVQVGCQISGIVASISADFNDTVYANQLIAMIDPAIYETQVQQAKANIENAKAQKANLTAQLLNQKSSLLSADADVALQKANINKAKANYADAERNCKRIEELFQRRLVATSDRDTARSNKEALAATVDASKAQLQASLAKVGQVKAQIESAKAQLEGSEAQIKQMNMQLNIAEINLQRTKIFSPIDGVIISRNVDVGQTVAASLQAPTLFTIANDLRKMQINTSVDEADIGMVKPEQRVTFTVDAYSGREFTGKVDQVRLSPTTNQNVVTYSVMVKVENDDLSLKPGMTANVEILVNKRRNVLRIPTKAMFFKPSAAESTASKDQEISRKPDEKASVAEVASASNVSGELVRKATDSKDIENNDNADESNHKKKRRQKNGSGKDSVENDAGIWILSSGKPVLTPIKTGLSTTSVTELLSPELKPGTKIIVAENVKGSSKTLPGLTKSGTKGARRAMRGH
ncbi:MAG: efflux RND transporter periplasmic adaptor subunit [Candidatus Riflebacteria bacterium]|nr:efflux RND transporter periplasmic adaptor subunit [Candidatus Riflebacteria bacterium]